MSYPNGTPCPDYERLELAHDLLAGALGTITEAMADAEDWDQARMGSLDDGLSVAETCETARAEALARAMDGISRLAQAGQNLPTYQEDVANTTSGNGHPSTGSSC